MQTQKTSGSDGLETEKQFFSTPFSAQYWKFAAAEFKSPRTLVIAALIVALRVAVKLISIPVGEKLHISLDFFVNSVGSMIYGPIVGLLVGAVSDTIGALVFPSDVYFFPFIFVEMLSSFIFGLFFYRAHLSIGRIFLARFTVTAACNLILNPIVMFFYYRFLYGLEGKSYALISLPRFIKNAALFPLEAIILVYFLGLMQPVLMKAKVLPLKDEPLLMRFKKRDILLLILLTAAAAVVVVLYYVLYLKNK